MHDAPVREAKLARRLLNAVGNMGLQRCLEIVGTAVVAAVTIRALSREEYGQFAVAAGYGLVFNLFNVSVSTILIRDYIALKPIMGDYVSAFNLATLIKSLAVFAVSGFVAMFLFRQYGTTTIIAVVFLNAVAVALTMWVEPFTMLLSVSWSQDALTKVSAITIGSNITLSLLLFMFPSAVALALKNVIVAGIALMTTLVCYRALNLPSATTGASKLELIRSSLKGFSLWTHLIGILTDLVYRVDLLFLGWLRTPLPAVGSYNIALQVANFGKIIPQILQYNANLVLGQTPNKEKREELTFMFIKLSWFISVLTMLGYWFGGRALLRSLTGVQSDEVFIFGLYILGGLCLYNGFRPLISYGIVVDDVRRCLLLAVLPATVASVAAYWLIGRRWGVLGMAQANMVAGAIMSISTLLYIARGTSFVWRLKLVSEFERTIVRDLATRIMHRHVG